MWAKALREHVGDVVSPAGRDACADDPGEAKQIKDKCAQVTAHIAKSGARILILGPTGVGKSTLVNAAFGPQRQAQVGQGMPCTQSITGYPPTTTCPVWLYDTKGLEVTSDNKDISADIRRVLAEREAEVARYAVDSPEYQAARIHAVWLVTGESMEPKLKDFVCHAFARRRGLHGAAKELLGVESQTEVPIFLVVNKCDKRADEVDTIVKKLKEHCPFAKDVIPVVADPKHGPLRLQCEHCRKGGIFVCGEGDQPAYICRDAACPRRGQDSPLKRCYGIEELLARTGSCLPEWVAASFMAMQQEQLNTLDRKANHRIIGFASTGGAIAGLGTFSGIPFGDWHYLIANEMTMLTTLASVYELSLDLRSVRQWMITLMGTFCIAGSGYTLAQCCKWLQVCPWLPGVGLAGLAVGAANVPIACSFTFALGQLAKELFRRVRKSAVYGEVTADHFAQVMGLEEQRRFLMEKMAWAPPSQPALSR